jgi:hypothetical protein
MIRPVKARPDPVLIKAVGGSEKEGRDILAERFPTPIEPGFRNANDASAAVQLNTAFKGSPDGRNVGRIRHPTLLQFHISLGFKDSVFYARVNQHARSAGGLPFGAGDRACVKPSAGGAAALASWGRGSP